MGKAFGDQLLRVPIPQLKRPEELKGRILLKARHVYMVGGMSGSRDDGLGLGQGYHESPRWFYNFWPLVSSPI
jgi:hypothetical protein